MSTLLDNGGNTNFSPPHNAEDTADNYEVFNAELFSKIILIDNKDRDKVTTAQLTDVYDKICGAGAVDVVVVSSWGAATLMAVYQ